MLRERITKKMGTEEEEQKEWYACQGSISWVRETSKFCHFCNVCHVTDLDFRMITHNRSWWWATLTAVEVKLALISFFSLFDDKNPIFWSNLWIVYFVCTRFCLSPCHFTRFTYTCMKHWQSYACTHVWWNHMRKSCNIGTKRKQVGLRDAGSLRLSWK